MMCVTKYWIGVVSKEHTMRGVAGSFMQVCHGKQAPLKRMNPDDWMIVYSPKQTMEGAEKCQSFTAIGQVINDEIYQIEMGENFKPFRRNIKFYTCNEISILPLIEQLEFIQHKTRWGYPFRFGFFEINKSDFTVIASLMINK